MEIRCPKCKYRFEEDIQSYETEHSCVCPRCGTPFMYSAHKEEEAESTADENLTRPNDHTDVVLPPRKETSASVANDKDHAEEQPEPYSARNALERHSRDYSFGDSPYHRHSRRRQRMGRKRLLYAAIAAVVFILGASYVANKFSTDPNAAAFADTSYPNMENDDGVDSLSELFNDTEEGKAEPAPSWIQGTWVAHTEYYDITITISGDSITETEGENLTRGAFVYKNQKLVCTYGENNIFIYRLDPNARTIDCGDGIMMHKTK